MKKLDFDLKLKLNVKRLYPNKSVKNLGIKIDGGLTWIDHINDTAIKLNRANATIFEGSFANININLSISIINYQFIKINKFIMLSLTVT